MTLDLQKVKADWIAALRSGKYERGTGQLRKEKTEGGFQYCCLGVLCDVIDPSAWSEGGLIYRFGEGSHMEFLPADLADALNFPSDLQFDLARRNDGCGYDRQFKFTEQADYIEQKWNPTQTI